jgi:hypothetical protein
MKGYLMGIMKFLRDIILTAVIILGCFSFCKSVMAEEGGSISSDDTVYKIKKGDTLWDISEEYLKNPFLWPNIWKENDYIKNPDLIYPGNSLILPDVTPLVPETGATEPPQPVNNLPVTASVPSPAPSTDVPVSLSPGSSEEAETEDENLVPLPVPAAPAVPVPAPVPAPETTMEAIACICGFTFTFTLSCNLG